MKQKKSQAKSQAKPSNPTLKKEQHPKISKGPFYNDSISTINEKNQLSNRDFKDKVSKEFESKIFNEQELQLHTEGEQMSSQGQYNKTASACSDSNASLGLNIDQYNMKAQPTDRFKDYNQRVRTTSQHYKQQQESVFTFGQSNREFNSIKLPPEVTSEYQSEQFSMFSKQLDQSSTIERILSEAEFKHEKPQIYDCKQNTSANPFIWEKLPREELEMKSDPRDQRLKVKLEFIQKSVLDQDPPDEDDQLEQILEMVERKQKSTRAKCEKQKLSPKCSPKKSLSPLRERSTNKNTSSNMSPRYLYQKNKQKEDYNIAKIFMKTYQVQSKNILKEPNFLQRMQKDTDQRRQVKDKVHDYIQEEKFKKMTPDEERKLISKLYHESEQRQKKQEQSYIYYRLKESIELQRDKVVLRDNSNSKRKSSNSKQQSPRLKSSLLEQEANRKQKQEEIKEEIKEEVKDDDLEDRLKAYEDKFESSNYQNQFENKRDSLQITSEEEETAKQELLEYKNSQIKREKMKEMYVQYREAKDQKPKRISSASKRSSPTRGQGSPSKSSDKDGKPEVVFINSEGHADIQILTEEAIQDDPKKKGKQTQPKGKKKVGPRVNITKRNQSEQKIKDDIKKK